MTNRWLLLHGQIAGGGRERRAGVPGWREASLPHPSTPDTRHSSRASRPAFLAPLAATAALLLALAPNLHAKEAVVQCANLIYGGSHTSRCFSDEFLTLAQKETTIATERRFVSVKLDSEELFQYPFVVITGEDEFHFSSKERENLRTFLEKGGFLLASAGCSSEKWDRSFRREIKEVFGENGLRSIPMDHPLFRTVFEIKELRLRHPAPGAGLEGLELNGKIVLVYSPHGLNDTEHTEGCCCCGGNEIENSLEVNVNVFVYALMH